MPLLLLGFARAESPEPPDPDTLMERARAGVAQMPGCFNLEGRAHDAWSAGLFGKGARTTTIGGTLDGGRWNHWFVDFVEGTPLGKDESRGSMFGRFDRPETEDPDDTRARVSLSSMLEDEVSTDYVEPDGAGWRLVHTLKGGSAGRNELVVRFAADGRPWRWTINLVDEVAVKGDRGKGKIDHMLVDLEAAPDGAPLRETLNGRFRSWPFLVDVDSAVEWTHTACPTMAAPGPGAGAPGP